jgi:GT2 family glycosyltransferase
LPAVEVLAEAEAGADRARRRGFEAARGGLIFCIDADCRADRGWLEAGIEGFAATGADILQGRSGSVGKRRADRLIQARYEAHLRGLRPGDGAPTDTRNMAFRREVLERIGYGARRRRTGDTAFGLAAEQAGMRVAYWPAMRVDHDHDKRLAVFVAKQACHGWGAQAIMRAHPEYRWHGSHLRLAARLSRTGRRVPGQARLGCGLVRLAVGAGRALDSAWGARIPERASLWALAGLDKVAGLGGHLLYVDGGREPLVSEFLGEKVQRE